MKLLSLIVILLVFNAMKILVIKKQKFYLLFIAGLTISDPVERTNKPLSVELGPGKILTFYC